MSRPVGQAACENTETRADLDHDVRSIEPRHSLDDAQDVLVDEEMLAERLLRLDGHGNRKAAAAFACVAAASSSAATPRASASVRTVCTTLAGSFGRPRTGCGLR